MDSATQVYNMSQRASIKQEIFEILEKAHQMFRTTFDGFMKHDLDILDQVVKDEQSLTENYATLTSSIVESSKRNLSKKEQVVILGMVDIVGAIERIGDCCVSLVERIEYKIRERLFFSEEAVEEYKNLYTKVDRFLLDAAEAIRMENQKFAKRLIEDESDLNELVDKYRADHIDRLARGICDVRASTMYLDMLDFTKEIVYHCVSMARQVLRFSK